VRELVLAHPHQIFDHRAEHLLDLLGIRPIVQGIRPDAVASVLIDKPGPCSQSARNLLDPGDGRCGDDADPSDLPRGPETVFCTGLGDGEPKPVPEILAVVALDYETGAIKGGAGERRLDIAFHEFGAWPLESNIRI